MARIDKILAEVPDESVPRIMGWVAAKHSKRGQAEFARQVRSFFGPNVAGHPISVMLEEGSASAD